MVSIVPTRTIFSLSLTRQPIRWIELVAISSAELTAAEMNATKKTFFWKGVTFGQPRANGTASRKANRTCTPGSATRSSFRSSISSRSWRCFGVSSASSTAPTVPGYPAVSHARLRRRRGCGPAPDSRRPHALPESDRPGEPDQARLHLVPADQLPAEGRRRLRTGADARAQRRRLRCANVSATPRVLALGQNDAFLIRLNGVINNYGGDRFYVRPFPEMNAYWEATCAYNRNGTPRGGPYTTAWNRKALARIAVILRGGLQADVNAKLANLGLPGVPLRRRTTRATPTST